MNVGNMAYKDGLSKTLKEKQFQNYKGVKAKKNLHCIGL